MSQSIDFRINDFVIEYLDYKGFNDTVNLFLKERQSRREPIQEIANRQQVQDKDQEKWQTIKVTVLRSARTTTEKSCLLLERHAAVHRRWQPSRVLPSMDCTRSHERDRQRSVVEIARISHLCALCHLLPAAERDGEGTVDLDRAIPLLTEDRLERPSGEREHAGVEDLHGVHQGTSDLADE